VAAIDQAGNQSLYTLPTSFIVTVDDHVNHGAGDCNISVGSVAGPLIPALFSAALLAFGLGRRRRLP
jgi:MYXO-CTERM domain-containing protein